MQTVRATLRQRADYTYKFNVRTGRHGWLRLTPAYSVKMVEEIVEQYGASHRILDPFCGTGTTALSAVNHGHDAATTDVNPFLVWLAKSKTAHYSADTLIEAEEAGDAAIESVRRKSLSPSPVPTIHKIERWWSPGGLEFLRYLRSAIQQVAHDRSPVRDLLDVAFCRTLIKLSNAAFNHQSMSFKSNGQSELDLAPSAATMFADDVRFVIDGASDNLPGSCTVVQGDARQLTAVLDETFDVVVTSPPYANRMSYIRELRPYMYWLGYLANGRDAAELDWSSIGGTWGVATSRLNDWQSDTSRYTPKDIASVISQIAHGENANGELLANYVAKYIEDMSAHFSSVRDVLNKGARVHYIVGNSTFYGVLVSTEQFYADILGHFGFTDIDVKPVRKRNSKKELIEFDVSATWP